MANCNKLFKDFNVELNVSSAKKTKLKTSKHDLRDRIRKDFAKNHPDYKPTFFTQGSSKLGTMIRTKDDECDMDDGVYFQIKPGVTGTTFQGWVKDAVKDATSENPEHRKKCIRVYYKGDYHIDLPVYYKQENDNHPFLGVKDSDWEESDPKEFIEWFKGKRDKNGQLVRVVRYLKAWGDHKRNKMPCGLVMSVLSEKNIKFNDRDDIALRDTLKEIKRTLDINWTCKMPVVPFDDLFTDYDDTRKNNFLTALDDFIVDANTAIDTEKNQLKASRLWQKHLGKYFPDGADEDVDAKEASLLEKAILINAGIASTNKNGQITKECADDVKNQPHKFYGN